MTSTNGTMRRIGDVVDLPAKLSEIDQARRRFRELQAQRHGWDIGVRCVSCGDTGWMPETEQPCMCETGREVERREKAELAWHDSLCPRRFRDYTLATHPNAAAVASVWRWIAEGQPHGQNLLLSGPVGTGKTGLAIAALRALHLDGQRVMYRTVPDALDAMRPNKTQVDPELKARELTRVGVLMLDDLGAEKASEWVTEQLYLIINGRYERELPTIVTTNRTLPELRAMIGERNVSRLTEDAAMVPVGGRDLRRAS